MSKNLPDSNKALDDARALLAAGDSAGALQLLERVADGSPAVRNARGVCLMRLGQIDQAVTLYRDLLLQDGSVVVAPRAPARFKANYATALLLAGNAGGGLEVLSSLNGETWPELERLLAAVARWRRSLGLFQRLLTACGCPPSRPVPLDFPPGTA